MTSPRAIVASDELQNVGDLALLLQCAHGLRTIAGVEAVAVRQWAPPSDAVQEQLARTGIAVLPGKSFATLREARRSIALFGGGQMVRDNATIASLIALIAFFAVAKLSATLAIGAGQLRTRPRRLAWGAILRCMSIVTVRDQRSGDNLRALAPARLKIDCTADLVFLPSPLHDTLQLTPEARTIIVAPCIDVGENRLLDLGLLADNVAAMATSFAVTRVVLVAHDARASMDLPVCDALETVLTSRHPHLEIERVGSFNLGDYPPAYAAAAAVVTNRLHSAIFGMIAGKPILIVDDGNPKLRAAAERFHLHTVSNNTALPQTTLERMTQLASNEHQTALAEAKRSAAGNFERLADLAGYSASVPASSNPGAARAE